MLVTLNDVLCKAQKEKYAVGLFNTVNLEMAKGVLAAAKALHAPVIIGTAEVLLPCAELRELAWFLKPMAEEADVPVVLHYDHGLTEKRILEAISLGFTSVMYDCSTAGYEENIQRVKDVVAYAHSKGVTVEGELGHVGANSSAEDSGIYTEPDQAADYVARTGVDALAVAIGTAHGVYKEKPRLDIARLRELRQAVPVPLVLHGGSGLTEQDFRNCIEAGISKVNIFTDINRAQADAAYENYREGCGATSLLNAETEAVKQTTMEKMRIFGCENQG